MWWNINLDPKNITDTPQLLQIISDYKSCLSRTPTETDAWLDLIAINIISFNWDEAISLYGQCKSYTKDKENQLIRSYLGCLAFIFAGDPIEEEDIKPLHDQTIRLDTLISRGLRISHFLLIIHREEDYKEKWNKAIEIEKILISHYDDYYSRFDMFYTFNLYEEALTALDKAIELDPSFLYGLVCQKCCTCSTPAL